MSQGMWDLKKLMFMVQGSLCFYCWKPMSQEKEHIKAAHYATKDHLVPVSQGGAADWTNTILACMTCNRAKGDRMPTDAERARHGHLYALFNERVELRRAELAAKEAKRAASMALPSESAPAPGGDGHDSAQSASLAGAELRELVEAAEAQVPMASMPPPEALARASLTPDA